MQDEIDIELELTGDGRAIKLGRSFVECSSENPRELIISLAGGPIQLHLRDHAIIWPSHQTTPETQRAYEDLARQLASRRKIAAKAALVARADAEQTPNPAAARARRSPEAGADGSVGPREPLAPRLLEWSGLRARPRIVHADWSGSNEDKRWFAVGEWKDAHYEIAAPRKVGTDVSSWISEYRGQQVLFGFDFAIGLPDAYPTKDTFLEFIGNVEPGWFQVNEDLDVVAPDRPFFTVQSRRHGFQEGELKPEVMRRIARKADRVEGDILLRRCETARPSYGRPAAETMFWCIGGKQVGRATIHGWQNVLMPLLKGRKEHGWKVKFWPFDGALEELVHAEEEAVVVLETYPGDAYSVLGVRDNKKTSHRWRLEACARIREVLRDQTGGGVVLSPELSALFDAGFGSNDSEEDPFDATIGAILMALVVLGQRAPGLPVSLPREIRQKEGWILGCDA